MKTDALRSINLLDPELYRKGWPHELYTDLRRAGPVLWHPMAHDHAYDTDVEFWAVIGHPEVRQANREWETFSAADGASLARAPERLAGLMSSMDPPDHTRLRGLISAGFTPRMIRRLEEQIRERCASILDDVAAKGTVDFVADVSYQLPMHIVGDIMGIPDTDRPEVFGIIDVLLRVNDPKAGVSREDAEAANGRLFGYAAELSAAKRKKPTDDVWSILAEADISGTELDLFFLTLTFAGSETTRTAITDGLVALLDHPEQLAALREDPSLISGATDEILRWSSPVLCFGRTVTRDVELGGQRLRAGDRVALFYPSANRDDRAFDDPFRFDIRRSPNPHVAFGGGGPHYCLGAHLAKTEVRMMFEQLVGRFRDIAIVGEPTRVSVGPVNNVGVSIQSLPVRLA